MSFLIICQSLQQIIKLYGPNNSFLEHCKTWVTYAPGDINSARTFSEVVGKESIWKESVSTSGSKFSVGLTNLNLSGNEVERNLINPDEIMRLPPTDLLVFAHGMPPYRGKKIIYYLDPRFKRAVNLPAPQTRADLIQELPPGPDSRNPWDGLESETAITMEASEGDEQHNPGKKKGSAAAGGAVDDLQKGQDITLNPEAFFPPDPFEDGARDSNHDPELLDSPFGSIRRGER